MLGQLIERHEIRVGLRCFVFDGAVSPAVCDQPFVPSLVVLFGCPLWIGQRRYSVTFGYIRGERVTARRLERHPDGERDPWNRPLDEHVVLVLANWSYAGTGYTPCTPSAELALASADMARGR